ncbi:hypothetical protein AUR04nite_12550 [Glutamicibacter uratoxydans]|uniref:acylphosphatase n=1 Tax=Glutamicibacter uratoxydans TaxID=43667 RepID=A0A4Y4DM99_GLUUR|nr:acylphosphatase [Glutamicibacter uratoxydans]GED05723.1 hypothetical protein AUR04nite_12550 [Glutamicibacter uratoxydans]
MSDSVKISITQAQTSRYRVLGTSRHGEEVRRTNALIIVSGKTADGTEYRGFGEAHFRSEFADSIKPSWEFLEYAMHALEHREFAYSTDDALVEIEGFLSSLGPEFLGSLPEPVTDEHGNAIELTFRGALLGLETALLDLVAKASGATVAELLGGQISVPSEIALHKVTQTNRVEIIQEVRVLLEESGAGNSPLWLDFGRRLGMEIAGRWPRRIIDEFGDATSREFVIYHPLLGSLEAEYKSLQATYSIKGVKQSHPQVRLAIDSNEPVSQAGEFQNGILVLKPALLGGVIATRRLLATLQPAEDIQIFLADDENSASVHHAVLKELAASLPAVSGVISPSSNSRNAETCTNGLGVLPDFEQVLKSEFVRYAASGSLLDVVGPKFNVFSELPYLQPLGPNGTKGHLMEREALALGLSSVRYSKGAFIASDSDDKSLVFKWSRSPLTSAVALSMCTHKEATRLRLSEFGVPVPQGRTFRNGDLATAKKYADVIGFPVVVKPAMGVRGIGVVAGIANQEELDIAFRQLGDSKLGRQDFIVEKHVHGQDYRIVVIGDEVVAAILRKPASVVGDGKHTVAELVLRKNAQRRLNPHLWGRPIIFDDAAEFQLEKAGLTPSSIPEIGANAMLSNSCSLSQGGDSWDVLDEMHPSIKEAAVAAVKAIPELAFCGVDFLLEDHTKPLSEQDAGICELNAHAAIGNCEFPMYGKPRAVAATFMDLCVDTYGMKVKAERSPELSVKVRVRGRVVGVGYRAWMHQLATEYGVRGYVQNTGKRSVTAVLTGPTDPVSALVAAAVLGPKDAKPTSVTTIHVPATTNKTFVIRATKKASV